MKLLSLNFKRKKKYKNNFRNKTGGIRFISFFFLLIEENRGKILKNF